MSLSATNENSSGDELYPINPMAANETVEEAVASMIKS